MMLATKQAVELAAYFVMVYFPINSVTLVWQMLLELRNSLNCYPLNFKLQWSLKVSSKLKNLYWDAINICLPLRLYERVQDCILLFQINWILYFSVCYCRIVLSAGMPGIECKFSSLSAKIKLKQIKILTSCHRSASKNLKDLLAGLLFFFFSSFNFSFLLTLLTKYFYWREMHAFEIKLF